MPDKDSLKFWIRQILFWIFALGLGAGLFVEARAFTLCWRITSLPGLPPVSCGSGAGSPLGSPVFVEKQIKPTSTPTPEPDVSEDVEYPTWDGASRINILFVGLRGGSPTEEDCPFCTDTLILLTVDPNSKTAGMLSIPRDMWVNIPGFSYSRINTAWTLGRGSKLPGGGPGLTMKTVSHFIGVPIDYYVQVDFDTFVDIINLIGGVDVYNNENIVLDPMAHGKDFPKVRLTCCGIRHLNGREALAFARCRHEEQGCKNGDVGRAERQQRIIFAIRDKVLDPANFTKLLAQAPQLYNTFSAGIHTNLSLDDAIRLAALVKDIPKENIKNRVIDDHMVIFDNTILGGQNASVMRPLTDKIRVLRDDVFTASGALGPIAHGDPTALMQADSPRVRILNGTSTANLDTRTGAYLSSLGVQATEFGKTKAYTRTTITLYSPKLYALRYLVNLFGISTNSLILIKSDPTETVDIEIRLGNDWIKKLPAGY
jgi:LCP family protein required for cell wall assembly